MRAQRSLKKRKIGIATQVFIGLGLGLLVGVFFGEDAAFLKIGGDAFIALLQITVIPYVMVALITSLGRLTLADAKALGLRGGSILLVLWAVGLIVVLLSPLAFPDWPSASFFSVSEIEAAKPVDFLKLYIPANVFSSLSNAVVPAIVVFSILFGLALINVKNKERVLDLLSTVGDGLMEITGFVGKIAPYGVFAITASAAGTIDIADLGRLQVYIAVYVAIALILSLWLIPGLIAMLTPLKFGAILHAFRGPLITAFATGNVLIVLPLLVADSKELIARYPDSGGFSLPLTRSHPRTDVRFVWRVVRRIDGLGHPVPHPLYRRHRQPVWRHSPGAAVPFRSASPAFRSVPGVHYCRRNRQSLRHPARGNAYHCHRPDRDLRHTGGG
jgi:Na+/H+-dicarboxylate symporter